MATMEGSFLVEGWKRDDIGTVYVESWPAAGPVIVGLATNGRAVWIDGFDFPRPLLTPDGWAQLAAAALRLRDQANAAWERMGAMQGRP